MPNPSSSSLTFYPAYCLSLSPTYNTWARLTAADVHALQERDGYDGQNIYFHLNHPIKWIRLVGVVVAVDCIASRWFIKLDDSSGATIELMCRCQAAVPSTTNVKSNLSDQTTVKTHEINTNGAKARDDEKRLGLTATGRTVDLTGVDIGAVVKVKGGVGVYREEKQVLLEKISLLHSTNDEVLSWAETSAFHRNVLNVPWVVNEQDLKRAARKAEGRGRRRKVRLDRATQKRQTLESKQKHEHEKAKPQNRETDELSAPARSKPDRVKPRIKGREVRIPPDQQRRLDRRDSWLPAEGPHQSATTLKQDRGDRNPMDTVAGKKQPTFPAGRYDALGL